MGSKRQDSPIETVFKLLTLTPAWVGPVLALIVFLGIRYVVPLFFPQPGNGLDSGILLRPLASMFSWIISGAILLVWLLAEFHKRSNRNLFDRTRDIDSIRQLSWHEFERFVSESYRRQGYVAEHIGSPSGDGGIDIILNGHGKKVFVQCKQWKAFKVGVQPVRELLGVVTSEKAARGILVTSGRFTPEAVRFAERNERLELIDGQGLASMISEVRGSNRPTTSIPPIVPASISPSVPNCPTCNAEMVLRTAKKGNNRGSQFWGCGNYPACRGTRPRA